jgi:hypothetical protein
VEILRKMAGRLDGPLLWSLIAFTLAALGGTWGSPTTSKGSAVWFGVAMAGAPILFVRTAAYRKVCVAVCSALTVFALLGTLFGFEALLPAAVLIGINARRSRHHGRFMIAGLSTLCLLAGAVLVNGIYQERYQQFDAYRVTAASDASGREVDGELQSFLFQHVDPIVDGESYGSGVGEVGFRPGATAAELQRLREELQHLPGVNSVIRCTGTLNC